MADAKITALSALTAITADDLLYVVDDPAGTPASKKAASSVMQNFILSVFGGTAPIAVTAATTATINRMHLCTGTSADYEVALPAVSGNTGQFLGFLMGTTSTLTKRITLNGNASETIDGALTRAMWSNEVAILYCDGSNWFKVAGKTIPMTAVAAMVSSVSSTTNTATKINISSATIDNTGAMVDAATNERVDIKRAGYYKVIFGVGVANAVGGGQVFGRLYKNGVNVMSSYAYCAIGNYPENSSTILLDLTLNDYLELYIQHYTGSTETGCYGAPLQVVEVPTW